MISPYSIFPGGLDQAHDRKRRNTLARSRFSHDSQRLAFVQAERYALHGIYDAVLRIKVGPRVVYLNRVAMMVDSLSSTGDPVRFSRLAVQARVERVAQAIAKQIEGQHRQHDRQAGENEQDEAR